MIVKGMLCLTTADCFEEEFPFRNLISNFSEGIYVQTISFVAAIASSTLAGSSQAYCHDDLESCVAAAGCPLVQLRPDTARSAEDLLDEIATWLSSNFDLPAIKDRPAIELASKTKLATMRAKDRAHWQGLTQAEEIDQPTQRRVVALYNTSRKRSSFLTTGLENHQRTNQSWFTRWFITFKIWPNSSLNARWRERRWPTWLRTNGSGVSE